ncbi:MAG: extracellular solute-binding protein [Lachnospiraceae bacterium]|nr:extracellular solute-binding protein [Lachnospiraceae bacterium]
MKKKSSVLSKIYIILCFAFFYLPIIVTVIFSFNSSKSLSKFTGFSLRWYAALIQNNEMMSAVYVSVTIAILATVFSTFLGTITAIGLSRQRKVLKNAILTMNDVPILNPDIVTAIGWMLLFSSLGFNKGYLTMLLAHIGFSTPFVITSVYPKVRSLDPNLANAAMDLGATPYQALTKVIIPMIQPGIFAGALLAFTMSFDDFVISYFVTGNGVKNISIVVYNMTKRINPTINALSAIVVLLIILVLIGMRISRKTGAGEKVRGGKLVAVIIAAALVLVMLGGRAGISGTTSKRELRVYNAGEYVDPELLTEFEEEFDCKVIYETFESNEMLYTKILAGDTYDILIPSDYMIERLIDEDYLQPVDWSLISNADAINPDVLDRDYDPGNVYSVPYFWGSVGILYDTTVVDEEDLADGWDLLMNKKYAGNLYMYDSERDSFMIALKALGYSMNTADPDEIHEAYEWLVRQGQTMDVVYAGDDVIDNMISGNKAIAVVYSGDGAYIMAENEDLEFFEPEQGTNIWCDAMVITKDCQNTDLAHEYIDFFLREDVAARNTVYIGYSTAVLSVYESMQEEDFAGISAFTPRVDYEKDEVFHNQSTAVKKMFSELWTMVKSK